MTTRVILYTRVSTDRQAMTGFSLDQQRRKCRAYVEYTGSLELVGEFEDAGLSARTMRRPGLQAALALLDRGEATALIIPKLDRLSRSLKDLVYLRDAYFSDRCALISLSESIDTRSSLGRMFFSFLGIFAEFESDRIRERVTEGIAEGKRQGRVYGPKPLAGPAVERIVALRRRGETLAGIAATLTSEGFRPPRGRGWSPETVRQALARAGMSGRRMPAA